MEENMSTELEEDISSLNEESDLNLRNQKNTHLTLAYLPPSDFKVYDYFSMHTIYGDVDYRDQQYYV